MSELDKTKQEMIQILEQIPVSGSYESAKLAVRISELSKKITALNSAPEEAPEEPLKKSA